MTRTPEERLRILKVRQLVLEHIESALKGNPLPNLTKLDIEIDNAIHGQL